MIITPYTAGGLGNLLFILANAYSLSKKYDFEIIIYESNRDTYPSNTPRKLVWEYDIFKNFKISKEMEFHNFSKYSEQCYMYNNINLNSNLNYQIHGYFQSYKYFWEYREDFINMLVNPYVDKINTYINELKNKYGNKQIISLHFRRTDYFKYPNVHNVLPIEFYIKALENFDPNDIYIFFSDDMNWVKEQVVFNNLQNKIFYDESNEELCLWLMSKCDHNIIANSSFSLWANYLNINSNKKTIVPSKWFEFAGPKYNIYDIIKNNENTKIINI